MVEPVTVAVFALGEGADEVHDAAQKEDHQGQDGAQLDDDGVHLPVGVVERDLHQRFGDAQVRRRADRQKFGQAFHNAQDHRLNVRVQASSRVQLFHAGARARKLRSRYSRSMP